MDKAKRGNKVRFWLNYRLAGGKQRREFAGDTLAAAEIKKGEVLRQVQQGALPEVAIDKKLTMQQLADWHLGRHAVRSKAYYPTLKINLASFCKVFGPRAVASIKTSELEDYQAQRLAAGYSEAYVDQELQAAKTVVNAAFDDGRVSEKVFRTFRKIKKHLRGKRRHANARGRILSRAEYLKLIDALPAHLRPVIATAFFTGMRRGEILNLTWNKVDMAARVVRLEAADTKDNEARVVPICNELFAVLRAIPRALHTDRVFLHRGKPMHDLRDGLRRACKAAGIAYGREAQDGFTFHDLRHSFNTHMRKAGVPESVIMEITGHSTREMFDRYNTVDHDDVQNAASQMEVLFASVDQSVDQAASGQ
jgi:integrase